MRQVREREGEKRERTGREKKQTNGSHLKTINSHIFCFQQVKNFLQLVFSCLLEKNIPNKNSSWFLSLKNWIWDTKQTLKSFTWTSGYGSSKKIMRWEGRWSRSLLLTSGRMVAWNRKRGKTYWRCTWGPLFDCSQPPIPIILVTKCYLTLEVDIV